MAALDSAARSRLLRAERFLALPRLRRCLLHRCWITRAAALLQETYRHKDRREPSCPRAFVFQNGKFIPEHTSGEQNSRGRNGVQSRAAYERYIILPKIAELMRTPCGRMNRASNFVVNHIKEAPMMTNALSSKANKMLNRN